MPPVLPVNGPLTETGVEKVTPPLSDVDRRTLLPFFVDDELPVAWSQATEMRLWWWPTPLPVSTVIIGLSSNCALPVSSAKNVDVQVAPWSPDRATAISE